MTKWNRNWWDYGIGWKKKRVKFFAWLAHSQMEILLIKIVTTVIMNHRRQRVLGTTCRGTSFKILRCWKWWDYRSGIKIVTTVIMNHPRQRVLETICRETSFKIVRCWNWWDYRSGRVKKGKKFVPPSASQMDSPLPYYRVLFLNNIVTPFLENNGKSSIPNGYSITLLQVFPLWRNPIFGEKNCQK